MFNFFRRATKLEDGKGNAFPDAKEMLSKTIDSWPEKSLKEIFQKMEAESRIGERRASFFRSRISKDTINDLRSQGYKVETGKHANSPYFEISW